MLAAAHTPLATGRDALREHYDLPRSYRYICLLSRALAATALGLSVRRAVKSLCAIRAGHIGCDALVNKMILDLLCQLKEGLVDVGVRLGGRLDVLHAQFFCKCFALLFSDDLRVR